MAEDLQLKAHDEITLAVRDHGGDGPPLVLMHGAGSTLLTVERLARELGDFRVVTFDSRWCGQSGDSPVYDWADLVRDVETVRDGLSLGNPIVAGHSWGGMIAAHYGVKHPEAPALVNLDGHGPGEPARWEGVDPAEVDAFIERMGALTKPAAGSPDEGDAEWLAEVRPTVEATQRWLGVDDDEIDAVVDRLFVDLGDGRWRRRPSPVMSTGFGGDLKLFDVYRQVTAPLLIFNCTAEQPGLGPDATPFMDAMRRSMVVLLDELCADHPNVAVATLPEADHVNIVREHAPVAAAKIRSFLIDVGAV